MSTHIQPDFISSLGPAFLAHRFKRLSDTFVDDIQAYLQQDGIKAPARSFSTLRMLARWPGLSVTQIADNLQFSHPLVIHLLSQLESLGLVTFCADDDDRRRRLVFLTEAGEGEITKLDVAEPVIRATYAALSEQIGVDLLAMVDRLDAALDDIAFSKRLNQQAQPVEAAE